MATAWSRARAPATIANVGPGFDVFCIAVKGPGDEVAIRPASGDRLSVSGVGSEGLPERFTENTAGIVLEALRRRTGVKDRLDVRLRKGIPPGRGLGSSAASCAAAALAFTRAFRAARSLAPTDVLEAAVEGEAAVAGRHYDNVAGALLGGFVSIASTDPIVLTREPVSPRIHIALAIPDLVLRTEEMRKVLPRDVPLQDAVSNVGKAATLALALTRGDAALAGRCLEDRFASPYRSRFLVGYEDARRAALRAGATGFAISGSGSTVFAIASTRASARRVAAAMVEAFRTSGQTATPLATVADNTSRLVVGSKRAGGRFSLVGR